MPRLATKDTLTLTPKQVTELTQINQSYTMPYGEVQRAKIVLLASTGLSQAEIGRQIGCDVQTVRSPPFGGSVA